MANHNLQVIGFNHVTVEGVANLCSMLDSVGTIELLNDLNNNKAIDCLMCTKHFNFESYAALKGIVRETEAWDELVIGVHEELTDAVFGIYYAFSQLLDAVDLPSDSRRISGIKSALESDEFTGAVGFGSKMFETIEAAEEYVSETVHERPVEVTAALVDNDEELNCQSLCFTITGAQDWNCMRAVIDTMLNHEPESFDKVIYFVY